MIVNIVEDPSSEMRPVTDDTMANAFRSGMVYKFKLSGIAEGSNFTLLSRDIAHRVTRV
jgi:hypothetical protein